MERHTDSTAFSSSCEETSKTGKKICLKKAGGKKRPTDKTAWETTNKGVTMPLLGVIFTTIAAMSMYPIYPNGRNLTVTGGWGIGLRIYNWRACVTDLQNEA